MTSVDVRDIFFSQSKHFSKAFNAELVHRSWVQDQQSSENDQLFNPWPACFFQDGSFETNRKQTQHQRLFLTLFNQTLLFTLG